MTVFSQNNKDIGAMTVFSQTLSQKIILFRDTNMSTVTSHENTL